MFGSIEAGLDGLSSLDYRINIRFFQNHQMIIHPAFYIVTALALGNSFDRNRRGIYNRGMKKILRKALGIICIILGLTALLTPFTPGSWLALIGLELLGIRLLIEKKFLGDKQRASFDRFMKKFGLKSSAKLGGDKSETKGDNPQPPD